MKAWVPIENEIRWHEKRELIPLDVLFYYDEPLIFMAKFEYLEVICYKYAEIGEEDCESSLYIASPVSKKLLDNLKGGLITIRGVLSSAVCFIFRCTYEGIIEQAWTAAREELPDRILPKNNIAIRASFGLVPDQLAVDRLEKPFMSINFLGGSLHAGEIGLLTLKGLLDSTYVFLRSLAIETLAGSTNERTSLGQLERMLVIPVRQPQLASLRLEIGKPQINKLSGKESVFVDRDLIDSGISQKRDAFFTALNQISTEAKGKRFSTEYARTNLETLNALIQLMPTDDTLFSRVEFHSVSAQVQQNHIVIDREEGQKIVDAYKVALRSATSIYGKIVEINFRSNSFVIETSDKREITCVVPYNWHGTMPINAGEQIALDGRLIRRKRRDLFYIRNHE